MNLKIKRIISVLVLTIISFFGYSQTEKIETAKRKIGSKKNLVKSKQFIFELLDENRSLPTDTFKFYLDKVENLINPNSEEQLLWKDYYTVYLNKVGDMDEALKIGDSLIDVGTKSNYSFSIMHGVKINRASTLIRMGKYNESIAQCFDIIKEAEFKKDTIAFIKSYTILSWAFIDQGKYNESLKWLVKGIELSAKSEYKRSLPPLYSNLATSYNNLSENDSAIKYVEKAIKSSVELQNLTSYANALNIRADIFLNLKNVAAAEEDLKEALDVRKRIGDELYIISDLAQLSTFYSLINEHQKGIDAATQGISIANKSGNLSKLIFLYSALAENYYKAKMKDDAINTLYTLITLKDSMYKKNSDDALAAMESKYQLQKKENIIIKQEINLIQTRYALIAVSIFLVLASILTYVLYNSYRQRQKRKLELALAKEQALARESVLRAEEKERKRIAADLHDNLGSYAAAITANVRHLKEDDFNDKSQLTAQLEDNAQNMVIKLSDTIWVLKNEHLPLTKLADRFKSWMIKMMQNYPEVKYHYYEEIDVDKDFAPGDILNIFLILKECVTNSLKHSNCTDIYISFKSSSHMEIVVEDNGNGFNSKTEHSGNGLSNIKLRAKEAGWIVNWKSIEPNGTRVELLSTTTN